MCVDLSAFKCANERVSARTSKCVHTHALYFIKKYFVRIIKTESVKRFVAVHAKIEISNVNKKFVFLNHLFI